MHWIWTSVARPALTYGSFVWGGRLNKTQLDQLESTQRAALTLTGHVRRSTPGSGLNIVTNTLPIDLFLQEHITKARLRLKPYLIRDWAGKGPGRYGKLGHIALSDAMLEQINLPDNNLDSHPTSKTWVKNYTIEIPDEATGPQLELEEFKSGITVYSDGSKMDNQTGFGAVVYQQEQEMASTHGNKASLQPSSRRSATASRTESTLHSKPSPEPSPSSFT
jgi:hypothetical protein